MLTHCFGFCFVFFAFIFVLQRKMADVEALLETVDECLEWVEEQNARTIAFTDLPPYEELFKDAKMVLESKERPPRADQVVRHGDYFHELVQDVRYPRGQWRRAKLSNFKASDSGSCSRADFDEAVGWEKMLDIGELSKEEGKSWAMPHLPEVVCY
jgi:prolyl oligopeptidase